MIRVLLRRPCAVLGLLFLINLVNYIDRQVLFALLPLIKSEFSLSDTRLGALASAFMLVYMCAAPVVGWFADRGSRKDFIAAGIGLWSLATFFSGFCRGYWSLFAARAAVGVGESGYGAVSPSFVAEHFPPAARGRVLAFFSMAIPVGSALGFALGGWIGYHHGWRAAFMVVGFPGFILAALAYFLGDPRDANEERSAVLSGGKETDRAFKDDALLGAVAARPAAPGLKDYLALYRIRSYVACTLAMAAMTFSLGGLAVWMPTFFNRFWGLDVAQGGLLFGGLTVGAGLTGSLLGGWLGDRLLRTTPKAYFLVSGAGLLAALPLGVLAVLSPSYPLCLASLFAAELFAFLNMGPLNGVIVGVTSASVRSMAFAANIFVIHALGDSLSPTLIGLASDRFGLKTALLGAMLAMGAAGLFCFWGASSVADDTREALHA